MSSFEQAYVDQFSNSVLMFFQREGSLLRGLVREEPWIGEFAYFDRIHPTAAVKRLAAGSDTKHIDMAHSRRRAFKEDYNHPSLVDKASLHNILTDPKSAYALNAGWAMGRSLDYEIITALGAAAIEGRSGGTSVAFPASQRVVHNSLNMNSTKLRAAKLILGQNDVMSLGLIALMSPEAVDSLLQENLVTSNDFNGARPLESGVVGSYMGFKIMQHTGLPKSGNIRKCYIWHPMAVGMGIGAPMETSVDVLPGKQMSTQIYVESAFGAVRVLDEGVVEIEIDESAGPA